MKCAGLLPWLAATAAHELGPALQAAGGSAPTPTPCTAAQQGLEDAAPAAATSADTLPVSQQAGPAAGAGAGAGGSGPLAMSLMCLEAIQLLASRRAGLPTTPQHLRPNTAAGVHAHNVAVGRNTRSMQSMQQQWHGTACPPHPSGAAWAYVMAMQKVLGALVHAVQQSRGSRRSGGSSASVVVYPALQHLGGAESAGTAPALQQQQQQQRRKSEEKEDDLEAAWRIEWSGQGGGETVSSCVLGVGLEVETVEQVQLPLGVSSLVGAVLKTVGLGLAAVGLGEEACTWEPKFTHCGDQQQQQQQEEQQQGVSIETLMWRRQLGAMLLQLQACLPKGSPVERDAASLVSSLLRASDRSS
eukprot:1148458-Pelagomonas_calceolata.AAC.1